MTTSSASYRLLNIMPCQTASSVLHVPTGKIIPPDPANTDYAAYLQWVEQGNTPDHAPIPVPPAPLTPAEKLAQSGLTVDELKALLGL